MANPKPDPEAAHRGREKGWATMRRRKEEKLAAELRARGWTCHPPELGVEAIATDPALSLNAKGVYLMHTVGLNMVDVRDRDPRGLQLLAGWAELARAGYMEPLS